MKVTFSPGVKLDQFKQVVAAFQKTEREFLDRPQPDRLENFDSQLAAETRLRAMYAILASWARHAALPVVPLRQLDLRPRDGDVPDPRSVLHARHRSPSATTCTGPGWATHC